MKRYENGCVGCPPEMGCVGGFCPQRELVIYVCDRCGDDIDDDDVYMVDDKHLCQSCLLSEFRMD